MKQYIKYPAIGAAAGTALMLCDMALKGQLLFGMEEKTAGIYFIAALLTGSRELTPKQSFAAGLLVTAAMGLPLDLYAVKPQTAAEWLMTAGVMLVSGGVAAGCAALREKFRLRVAFTLFWLIFAAAEGLEMLTAYFTLGKGLPLSAIDLIGAGVCLWVMTGHKKRPAETDELPDHPTDEDGNRLPDGDEQWLL